MPRPAPKAAESGFDFYAPHYQRFASDLAARIRREVYGEDHGQTGWRTAAEQHRIAAMLGLGPGVELLDIACGSGGPSLALVETTGCHVVGLDIEPAGIAHARSAAAERGLAETARFEVADCSGHLPFAGGAFAALLCIDAVSSFPDRVGTVTEWGRLLRPGGRLLFTDAVVLTGEITKGEIDVRASQGACVVVPAGWNEMAIRSAGLELRHAEDTTASVAAVAARLHDLRTRHAAELAREEGADWFAARQSFLKVTAELAASHRLGRFLFLAEKPVT